MSHAGVPDPEKNVLHRCGHKLFARIIVMPIHRPAGFIGELFEAHLSN